MAEVKQLVFGPKELAEILIQKEQITEGFWGIFLEFGLGGGNVQITPDALLPAAIVSIQKIGIQRFDAPNPLTVDASALNAEIEKTSPTASKK